MRYLILLLALSCFAQDVTVIRKKRTTAPTIAFKGGWAWSNADEGAACASPCTVTLAQSASVGDTIVVFAVTSFDNFSCSDSGSNTYVLDQQGNNAALCHSVAVGSAASTVTVTATAFGSNVLVAARVISGSTARDGSNQWQAPSGTAFDTESVSASANGLAVGAALSTASNPKPITFDSPWTAASTRANASGWVLSVTDATTTSGGSRALGGDSTTNAVARAGMAVFK